MGKTRLKKNPKVKRKGQRKPTGKGVWVLSLVAVALMLGILLKVVDSSSLSPSAPLPEPSVLEIPLVATEIEDSAVSDVVKDAIDSVDRERNSAEAWGALGMVYLVHEFKREARIALAEAFRLDPESGKWRYFQAISNFPVDMDFSIEMLIESKELLEKSGSPGEVMAVQVRLANVLLENGRYQEAEREYEAVLKKYPEHLAVVLGLGQIRNLQGRLEESVKLLQRCVSHPSTRKRAAQTLAVVHVSLGDSNAAEMERARADALPLDQAWSDAFVTLASSYRTGFEAMLEHARGLMSERNFGEAVPLVERIIKDYPESPVGYLTQAELLTMLGDFAGAESALRETVKRDETNAGAWVRLGLSLGHQRAFFESVKCFRRALELSPSSGETYFNLGFALKSMENNEEALEAFENAIRFQPELVDSYIAAALIFEKNADFTRAKEYLERGSTANPSDVRVRAAMERIASSLGNSSEAQ